MKYLTRDFGEIEVDEKEIITFVQPPLGFEEYKKFVMLHDLDIGESFVWMQSLEMPSLCFILFDPSLLAPMFDPQLPDDIGKILGNNDEYVCWVVAAIPKCFADATVNLKSPIFVNRNTQKGAQIILEQDYPTRFKLMKGEK